MFDAWQRRKQYEAKLLSLELVKLLAEALNGSGDGSGSSGGKWVDTDALLERMGVTDW
jgi:hypothetical protein